MFFFQTISSLLTRTFCALGLSKLPSTCLEKPYEGKYHIWWKNILSLNLGFLARTYQQDSKCISTVQRKFWGKKVCLKENPTKTFLAFSANTFLLNEEEKFENRSRNLSQKFAPFGEKFLARFSKRHLTCTEERFELKSFFWHFFFQSFPVSWRKTSGSRVLETEIYESRGRFCGTVLLKNQFFHNISGKKIWTFTF